MAAGHQRSLRLVVPAAIVCREVRLIADFVCVQAALAGGLSPPWSGHTRYGFLFQRRVMRSRVSHRLDSL